MIELARYLHFAGRAELRPVEHRVAAYAGHLFWLGGVRQPVGAIRPTALYRQGIGASPMHAGGAIRGLEAAQILERIDRVRFRLNDEPARWRWSPGEYERVSAEWRLILEPAPPLQLAVVALLRAMGLNVAPHRIDPVFWNWLDAVLVLVTKYGEDLVREALAEAARDPQAVYPAQPDRLPEILYPLLMRSRRRRAVS